MARLYDAALTRFLRITIFFNSELEAVQTCYVLLTYVSICVYTGILLNEKKLLISGRLHLISSCWLCIRLAVL